MRAFPFTILVTQTEEYNRPRIFCILQLHVVFKIRQAWGVGRGLDHRVVGGADFSLGPDPLLFGASANISRTSDRWPKLCTTICQRRAAIASSSGCRVFRAVQTA